METTNQPTPEQIAAVRDFLMGPGEVDVVEAWKETNARRRSFAAGIVAEAKDDWALDLEPDAVMAVLDHLAFGEPYGRPGSGERLDA